MPAKPAPSTSIMSRVLIGASGVLGTLVGLVLLALLLVAWWPLMSSVFITPIFIGFSVLVGTVVWYLITLVYYGARKVVRR